MNIKKLIVSSTAGMLLLANTLTPALAVGKAIPKATGDYGYNIYGVQRYANFEAQKVANGACTTSINLTGSYVFSLYNGLYTHDITLTQTGSSLTVVGGYPAGGPPYAINETGTGSIAGNTFTFTNNYTEFSYSYTVSGTVNTDGSITVTSWSGGPGSDWTVSGNATITSGCDGRGTFNYSDVNGVNYTVDVQYIAVDGKSAWFTGPIVSGNFGIGQWIFIKVVDNGEPGTHDVTAGDFPVTETQGKNLVSAHADPSISTPITSGNIQVH